MLTSSEAFSIVAIANAFEAPADCPNIKTLFFTVRQHQNAQQHPKQLHSKCIRVTFCALTYWITAKISNVFLNPSQRQDLIPDAKVAVEAEARKRKEAQRA